MEEYTEKQIREGYVDFSVEKEHGRVYREAKNGRVYIYFSVEKENGRVYRELIEWKGI